MLGKYWKIVSQSGEGYSFGVVPGEMMPLEAARCRGSSRA